MFGPFGPNILSSVWILTLLLFYVEGYFSLSFCPIDFKPWHNDPCVLGRCAVTFLRIPNCSSGYVQDFVDHYVDQCWYIDLVVGIRP